MGENPPSSSSSYTSGQILATSHDLTPNGGLVREIPLFQENLDWLDIIIWPDAWKFFHWAAWMPPFGVKGLREPCDIRIS